MKLFIAFITLCVCSSAVFAKNDKFVANLYGNYLKGLFSVEEGDYEEGVKYFRKVQKADPHSIHPRLKIAMLLIRLGKIEEAEQELKEAKKIDPDNFDVSLALIFLYSYANREKELEGEYENFLKSAVKLKPEDKKIAEYLAQYYLYKKNFKEAITIYEAILSKDTEYIEGIFWLGYLYEEIGERKDAVAIWKKGLSIAPAHSLILNSLGYVYAEEGINLDEAEQMIKQALAGEPNNGAYLDSMGWVYYKKKDYPQAEKYLKQAIELVKDPVIYEHLGDLYIAREDIETAVKFYKEGLQYFPEDQNLMKKMQQYEQQSAPTKE